MSNAIHPTAIISPKALIGDGNSFGPFTIVYDNVEIGDNNVFTSHVSIGSPPEHKFSSENHGVVIGSNNIFREFITINAGTEHETRIGSFGYFMRGTHFGHDCQVHDHVTLACNSIIGGHTIIMDYANLGLGAITHQQILIPQGCMLGAGSFAPKNLYEPWTIYMGTPAKKYKDNIIGKQRANLTHEQLRELEIKELSLRGSQRAAYDSKRPDYK